VEAETLPKTPETFEQITQIVEAFFAYGSGVAEENELHRNKIKNTKKFIAVKRDNTIMFAPVGFIDCALGEADPVTKNQQMIESQIGLEVRKPSDLYDELDTEYLAYCDEHEVTPSTHPRDRRYWLINEPTKREPAFYWTKVWGQPGDPSEEALLFNAKSYRDRAQSLLHSGDIVVYLTSDATHADPAFKGRVAGAVEVVGNPVMAKDMGIIDCALPEHFREDGSFRWPYGLTIGRSWRVLDTESNDNLIKDHATKKLQGAAFIHLMRPEEVGRFLSLRVEEQGTDITKQDVFRVSLKRPWRQKQGLRASSEVNPGTDLYVAWIADSHGITVKIGSGQHQDRIAALNQYRRPSQGEHLWALAKGLLYEFPTVEGAREAEDYLLAKAKEEGFGSPDHNEFLTDVPLERLSQLFGDAVSAALAEPA
jgi:hypothetical protein